MDWIRRNWPDMLIGIALVAVIAGIIATLLTGGSFFPLGQSDSTTNRPRSSQSSSADAGTSLSGAAQARSSSTVPDADSDRGGDGADAGGVGTPNGSESRRVARQGGVEVTALPIPGTSESTASSSGDRAQGTANGGDAANGANADTTTSGTAAGDRLQRDATATTPARSAAADSGDAEGLYRISVGAFSSEENAERQATMFRAEGYPVFIGSQGELSIVLVGPYDGQAEAERIAARIRGGDFQIEPVIYRFRQEDTAERAASSREQPAATPAPAASTPAPAASTPDPQPTASEAAGARYLQVGAYANAGSALPQRQRLEGLGFRVTERSEGNLVKLLVGPFAGDDLTVARSRLNEQGIEHFPR